jgi:hypothetical protein
MRRAFFCLLVAPCALLAGCASKDVDTSTQVSCVEQLEMGDPDGHADPFGAKAAGQARAGRLHDVSDVAQPAHGRQGIQNGDFVLANDKIAVAIEDGGLSDGYARFGGEIISVDQVGDDGRPTGKSRYVETLMGIGLTQVNPTSVTVLQDGSDGGDAIVRVIGRTEVIPFVTGSLSALFPSDFDVELAVDYVLAPGSEKLDVYINVRNESEETLDTGLNRPSVELFGFFHGNHNQVVTSEHGFAAEGFVQWVGFIGGEWNFAWRNADGPLEYGLAESGFTLYNGPGYEAAGCSITSTHRVEVIAGGPYYDGLRETIRRVDDAPAWRAISGTVTDSDGNPIANAHVHELDGDDLYLSRTITGDDGSFTIHAPPGDAVRLVAQLRGYAHAGLDVDAMTDSATLAFEPHATIVVDAVEMGSSTALPVRVQIIPTVAIDSTPESHGILDERNGRLHQEFAVTGSATLVVPPGEHRVVVTRGYEYELHDETVTVAAGETAQISAALEHSVDTSGVLCADFHIHSFMSADSSDPIVFKVKGAVADGLDIPVSSEHEWVVDFAPVIEKLGLQQWAFGMPASELTTFSYGHFGVVPLLPKPGAYNNGAIDWLFRDPAEVFALVDELPEQSALIVHHPRGGIGGYFSSMLVDTSTGEARDPRWSDNFDAIEVFNSSSFDGNEDVNDWFNMLNLGLHKPAVGSSDSHTLRSKPAGYPRTCMYFGHDDLQQLSHEDVRDSIIAGTSTISGGLFMTVAGPGGERPGDDLSAGSNTFSVTVESPGFIDARGDLEVWVNGALVSTETLMPLGTGSANRYVNQVTVDLNSGDWVVFHAAGDGDLAPLHPGRTPFAVSNPLYVP